MGLNMVSFSFVLYSALVKVFLPALPTNQSIRFTLQQICVKNGNLISKIFADESVCLHTAESSTEFDAIVFTTYIPERCRTRAANDESNVLIQSVRWSIDRWLWST